ncbi:MAG: hypothetical protein H7222_08055 [Methylotenera sp.]|nr:hypothetical protein [Oligoflexia bacterium]
MTPSSSHPKSRGALSGSRYSKYLNPWLGFLSNRSVVMARPQSGSVARSSSPEAPQTSGGSLAGGTFEPKPVAADPVSSVGVPGLEIKRLSFVSEKRNLETQALLERMIGALGLSLQGVSLIETDVEDFAFRKVNEFNPKVDPALIQIAIVFGKPRSGIYRADALEVMPTHSLETILTSPAAKKEAWADLQQVAKLLGLTLPKGPRS